MRGYEPKYSKLAKHTRQYKTIQASQQGLELLMQRWNRYMKLTKADQIGIWNAISDYLQRP